jgi:serine/threonine protein kinase
VNVAPTALQTFGKYQILERIAMGGTAEIYKARLDGIGGFQRTFAIKRILPNLSGNSEYIGMLVEEAKIAGLLSHANIVQILDLGQVDEVWYIAMEYVHGRDLGAVLRRARKKGLSLPVPHSVFVAIEVLKGLEYAHNRQVPRKGRPHALNIIHRDVSPPNVLLSFQGEVKLTDFGIAHASREALETASGGVRGRFEYMSPEQAAAAPDLDQRSDLFSVGVVLYEALAGHHPFRAETEVGTIDRVRTGRYVPVRQRNAEVPPALEAIVDRALQVDREQRYPTATAFKEALDRFFHDAGFLFSHATLAAYVRGLFPDMVRADPSLPGTSDHGVEPVHGGTVKVASRPASAERPTRQFRLPSNERGNAWAEDLSKATPGPKRAGDAPEGAPNVLDGKDQETLLRNLPAGWDADDPQTQLRPFQATSRAPPSLSAPTSPILAERHPARPVVRTRSSTGWLWFAGFTFAFGAFAGISPFLVAALLGQLREPDAAPRPDRAPDPGPPRIEIVAPPGSVVEIDGAVVGGPKTVDAGVPHTVRVALRGAPPWTTTLTLDAGQTRVIVVTAETPAARE